MIKNVFLGLVALSISATSCSSDDDGSNSALTTPITLNFNGLEDLGPDYVYEGWIIVNGTPVSTGIFSSVTFPQTFNVNSSDLANATTFVLSIEPSNDPDPAPSDTKLLSGDFSNNSASLTINAMVGDLSTSNGQFILRTPTDESGTNNGNDYLGIWWINPANGIASLSLPELQTGWIYEGWIVVDTDADGMPDTPLSTGRFSDEGMADSSYGAGVGFNGNMAAGPMLPGEDFFNNLPAGFPASLVGGMAVISVEPIEDNSSAPFAIKPLVTNPIEMDTAPTLQDMNFSNASFPTGVITR